MPWQMMISTLIRKARGFARRSRFEQAWFVPAWLLLGAGRLLILAVPFRSLAGHLGMRAGIAPWAPLINARREAKALAISRVIRMAARYTPWTSNCFVQAVAARVLLGIHGIPYCLFFGVGRDPGAELQAHAWVVSGRVQVSGGESFDKFTVVGCFAAPELAVDQ